ncbi:MAG: hypothetical protein AB8C95_04260 [Phycisphaeraceae bacterium]
MADHSTKTKRPGRCAEAKSVGLLNGMDHGLGPTAQPVRKTFDRTSHQQDDSLETDDSNENPLFPASTDNHPEAITDFIMFILIWIALPAWIFSELVIILDL